MTATILVIDDSEDDRHLYQRAFQEFDCFFNLVMTSSAEEGLASAIEHKPDLILLDYNLPDLDGLSFMNKLAAHSDIPSPIIMLTGESSVAVAVEAMKHGVDDYLVKDTEGRYLRLLPGVAGRVMATHVQRELTRQLQKKTEALLLRNQILMQNSMDGIHIMDMQGNLVEANNAFCRMLGYTLEEMARLNVVDWDAHFSIEFLRGRFKELIGNSDRVETVHRRKDGVLIDVEISVSGLQLGEQEFIFASSRDITERKRAEVELKLSSQLLNNTSDSVFLIGLDGNFIYANETAWKSRGYTRDEMMAMNVHELNTPEFSNLLAPRIKDLLEKGHGLFEAAHCCKDGSIMPVEVSACIIESGGRQLILAGTRDITERKKAEAVSRQHKQVIDTSIDGFWICDMRGYLLEANEAYAKLSGYTAEELMHMHVSQLEAIEQLPEDVHAHIAKVVEQGYDRFDTRHRHKDGHEIDIEISVTHMAQPPRLVIFCRDITERKAAAAALLKSEANLRAMLDNSPYLTWLKDSESRYLTINKVFADYLKLEDASQAVGKTDMELQPRELAEKYIADDALVMATRQQKHVEESAFDGETTHWVETFKTPIVDSHGNVLGTVGFARDITERKRSEEKLRESEASLKDLLENLSSGVAVYHASPDGQDFFISSFNRAAERIENICREEVICKSVVEAFPSGIEFGLLEVFRRVWQSGVAEHFPISFYQDGRIAGWRENYVYKLPNGEIVAIYDDVTQQKQTEEKILLKSQTESAHAEELAQRFGHLLQSSFNEIYLFDANTLKFILTSEGAEQNLGYSDEELKKLTPLDLKHPYTKGGFESLISLLRSGEQQTLLFESAHRRKNGTTYPVEIRMQLMGGEHPVFLAIVQDISERKAAEEEVRFHSNILKNLAEGIVLVRASDGRIVFTNAQFERLFGYQPDELMDKHVSIINAPSENRPEEIANAILSELAQSGVWRGEVHNIRKDGTKFWCRANVSTFEHFQFGKVWVSVHEDITERKFAEQQALDLSAHLQTVREEEKANIAREVHDDLGSTLAALKMDAYWLAGKLAAREEMQPLQACAKSMSGLLDNAVLATRRIITDLRPTILDELGLMAALKWQCAEFQKRTGIKCRLIAVEDQDLENKLDKLQRINLFRIAQEALTNAARHAMASKVEIDFHQKGKKIVMTISDNGCGLPKDHVIASTSYGMRGMRERVASLHGEIKFDTPPEGGFSVLVKLPLLHGSVKN